MKFYMAAYVYLLTGYNAVWCRHSHRDKISFLHEITIKNVLVLYWQNDFNKFALVQ